jgi:hypothetical protein
MKSKIDLVEKDLRERVRATWGKGGHGLDWIEPNEIPFQFHIKYTKWAKKLLK